MSLLDDIAADIAVENGAFRQAYARNIVAVMRWVVALHPEMTRREWLALSDDLGWNVSTMRIQFNQSRKESVEMDEGDSYLAKDGRLLYL